MQDTPTDDLYDTDPHAWAMREADRLRDVARKHPGLGLDFPRLIEEIDGMAGSDRRRVESLAEAVMQHLLLLEHSPANEPKRGWKGEVIALRAGLRRAMTRSLKAHLAERLDALYDDARWDAIAKMRLYGEAAAADRVPEARPYTLEQVLDRAWWPPDQVGGRPPMPGA